MGRKSTVEKLTEVERDAIIQMIADGKTDLEISTEFEKQFDKPLPKSSLNRWRHKIGTKLIDFHHTNRVIARTLANDLKKEPNADNYKVIIDNLEDFILTAGQKLYKENPLKLLFARQEDERIKFKRQQLDLNERKFEFDKQKAERELNVRVDRLAIAAEVWKYLLVWFSTNEPHLADGLTRNSSKFLVELEEHLGNQNS